MSELPRHALTVSRIIRPAESPLRVSPPCSRPLAQHGQVARATLQPSVLSRPVLRFVLRCPSATSASNSGAAPVSPRQSPRTSRVNAGRELNVFRDDCGLVVDNNGPFADLQFIAPFGYAPGRAPWVGADGYIIALQDAYHLVPGNTILSAERTSPWTNTIRCMLAFTGQIRNQSRELLRGGVPWSAAATTHFCAWNRIVAMGRIRLLTSRERVVGTASTDAVNGCLT